MCWRLRDVATRSGDAQEAGEGVNVVGVDVEEKDHGVGSEEADDGMEVEMAGRSLKMLQSNFRG